MKKKGKAQQIVEEEEESDPNKPPELIPKTIRQVFAHLTSYSDIEDFFLSVSKEYIPFITAMIDKSKEDLDYYADFIENGNEKIEEMKDDLLNQFEFWDIITGEDNPF